MSTQLKILIEKGAPQDEIARYLDWLSHESRLKEIYPLPGSLLEKLYDMAKPGVTLNDLIPSNVPANKQVIFYGLNSLKQFRKFQKRLIKNEGEANLSGYNYQPMSWVTGPGYFTVKEDPTNPGEAFFDYTSTPTQKLAEWPALKSNDGGIRKMVYGNLKDYMRQVSRDVFIGKATKEGKLVGYFILCRETLPV